jgi:phosphatidylserine synthase
MTRKEELGLGAGLILLAVIGLFTGASTWLCAAFLVGAVWALISALVIQPDHHGDIAIGLPIVLSVAFVVLFVTAVTAQATPWMTWMTLVVAAAAALEADDAVPGGLRRHLRHR